MFETKASRTKDVRPFEKESAIVAREIAGEGIVLLENNGVLPLAPGKQIALYGEGAACTVKGGVGSGEVNARYNVTIWEGLKNAGYAVTTEKWLKDYQELLAGNHKDYLAAMRKKAGFLSFSVIHELLSQPFKNPEGMQITEKYLSSKEETCVYVVTRQSGEEMDRKPEKGDFLLTDTEVKNIHTCAAHYRKMILVINIGGYIDLTPLEDITFDTVIFFGQQGQEGGNALADVISGKVTPSGHLASSWPRSYSDVPFGDQFSTLNGNVDEEEYREGIYVGYRYYDSFGVSPRYPFGYGLSYTTFERKATASLNGTDVTVKMTVANTGNVPGKDVAQIYLSSPAGKLDKPYQALAGFAKTKLLQPGEEQTVTVAFPLADVASFDDKRNAFVLEAGDYIVRFGAHSRDTAPVAVVRLDAEAVISQHAAICPKQKPFEELKATPKTEALPENLPVLPLKAAQFTTQRFQYKDPEPVRDETVQKELARLKDSELHYLCTGSGVDIALPKHHGFIVPGACGYSTGSLEKKGIPAISFCDGPAGLRLFDECVMTGDTVRMTKPVMESFAILPTVMRNVIVKKPKEGKMLYQYPTAFPVGMSVAQSWNVENAELYGKTVQREMDEFGVEYWLAPGMNIHRNPLCGRNYEYYSEDPLLSGMMAASVTKGVQSKPGYGVTMKHFCCNNQEINRMRISENVGQRALREIYLKNFQIAIRACQPKAIMTSYNKINGVYSAENHDTVTKVLRCEWGFRGLVMTDWTTDNNLLNSAKAMRAGVDVMMPGIGSDHKQIQAALKSGELSAEALRRNASFMLKAITDSRLYQRKYAKECVTVKKGEREPWQTFWTVSTKRPPRKDRASKPCGSWPSSSSWPS